MELKYKHIFVLIALSLGGNEYMGTTEGYVPANCDFAY